ncbi:hypothetical protein EAS61_41780 [Bradyrhizobium zhanjiangense]|uniref:Uncharacterized protein n=2 Tax=Bradyrhizobium zhanjiangense TaxID=1325107 RepID=A0A4Q0Q3J4_9BRAD|nr:hypothetical protein EAS61_41780 [Bradyrhizobium zhanjiangense]
MLLLSVGATIVHDQVMGWLSTRPALIEPVRAGGVIVLAFLLSSLTVTVLWSLYFLTDIVNRKAEH